jgi:hypothetical protein
MNEKIKSHALQIFLIFALFFISACGLYKKTDVRKNPINDADKRAKNIEEGKGISFGGKKNTGVFDFASSNEMWRATFDVLDFVPLLTADYSGGVIITDWYSDNLNSKDSLKVMVKFLSNEIRADGLDIKIYKKFCDNKQNCVTELLESDLNKEIKLAILKKAAQLKLSDDKKKTE